MSLGANRCRSESVQSNSYTPMHIDDDDDDNNDNNRKQAA
jgi:hypothetical protein